jgi:hypothetical protein
MGISRMEGEPAATLGIENGREGAGRIQVGKAQPVDRAIQAHQRERVRRR